MANMRARHKAFLAGWIDKRIVRQFKRAADDLGVPPAMLLESAAAECLKRIAKAKSRKR